MLAAAAPPLTALVESSISSGCTPLSAAHHSLRILPGISAGLRRLDACTTFGLPWNIWHPLIIRNPHWVMFGSSPPLRHALHHGTGVSAHRSRTLYQTPLRVMVVLVAHPGCSTLRQFIMIGDPCTSSSEQVWYSPLLSLLLLVGDTQVGHDHLESWMIWAGVGAPPSPPGEPLALYGILNEGVPFTRVASGACAGLRTTVEIFPVPCWRHSVCCWFRRENPQQHQGLYLAAVLTLLGFVTNRLNIAITV